MTAATIEEETLTNLSTPLTNRQIVSAIQDVVQVMLGVTLQVPDYSSVKTPATGITVCTPNAPIVSKASHEHGSASMGRSGSLDTLTNFQQGNSANISDGAPLSAKSQEDMDVENEKYDVSPDGRKFISRSSPAIHISSVSRSDTFIREESEKNAGNKELKQKECDTFAKNESTVGDLEKLKSHSILQRMEDLRKSAFDVISKIDEVKKEVYPHSTKPIRRLSSISAFPGLSRSSALMRPIQPPKLRRSSTGFPGTPTSSKLNTTITTEKEHNSNRRKTIAVPSIQIKPQKTSPNLTPTFTVSINKKSPLSSGGGRPAKNPKYAHVQSTIPKALAGKRKAP